MNFQSLENALIAICPRQKMELTLTDLMPEILSIISSFVDETSLRNLRKTCKHTSTIEIFPGVVNVSQLYNISTDRKDFRNNSLYFVHITANDPYQVSKLKMSRSYCYAYNDADESESWSCITKRDTGLRITTMDECSLERINARNLEYCLIGMNSYF